jgi:hypothetical protein
MLPDLLNSFRSLALNNTGVVIKSTPGVLCGWSISNSNAAARYVKIYNKATAPTSADTPVLVVLVPATSTVSGSFPGGITMSAGISARCVTGITDADVTGAGANEVATHLFYQ